MLVREKIDQSIQILKELKIDAWMTFVRESEANGDPILDLILGAPVTWHSAFIVSGSGETVAIVGKYDRKTVEDTGAYRLVLDYVESGKKLILDTLQRLEPSMIAINYSRDSEICDGLTHGMYLLLQDYLLEIGFEKRLVSAEKIISALRQRKTPEELHLMKEAITATEKIFDAVADFITVGTAEAEIAAFMKEQVDRAGLELAWDE